MSALQQELGERLICGWPRLRIHMQYHHCPGCHYGIILRLLMENLEELEIDGRTIMVSGGGCSGRWVRYLDVDATSGIHGPGVATATGIKRTQPDAIVLAVQGDGEMGAIGLGSFVAGMLRAEKITAVFLNNGCYGTTGGQMAPTTLLGMRTTTTSTGRDPLLTGFPIHAAEMAATIKGVAYSARVSVHTPANRTRAKRALREALQKQIDGVGFSLVEVVSACPPNWSMGPVECLHFIDNSVLAEFPLGEFKNVDHIDYEYARS